MPSPTHTIMFTAMPRALSIDPATLPVSVLVSPRLAGAPTLGSFPDLLNWTERLKTNGLQLTFATGGQTHTVAVDTDPLQPGLWSAIFDEVTHVDDYAFDDFSQRLILSYPNRATLAVLKSIFQIGGLQLALPDQVSDERQGKRRLLLELIDGLAVDWNHDRGRSWRDALRSSQAADRHRLAGGVGPAALNPFRTLPGVQAAFTTGDLGGDGLPNATQLPLPGSSEAHALRRDLAVQFALYHHLPPAPSFVPPDMATVIDFHKAITALPAYPALLRALGLVFDLRLPADFLPLTSSTSFGSFGVTGVAPGWAWEIPPTPTPFAMTAYDYLALGGNRIFLTAPRQGLSTADPSAEILGLLNLDPRDFGLAQVDIDGAMHKTIIVAESVGNTAPALH